MMRSRGGALQTESLTTYALQEGQLVEFVVLKVAVSFGMIALPCVFGIFYLLAEAVLDLGVERE